MLGVRGPFGTSWDIASAAGRDLVIVAGGVGLAPLRPVVLGALASRGRYGRVVLIAGARTPAEFLFRGELDAWAVRHNDLEVELTIDQPADGLGRPGRVRHRAAGPAQPESAATPRRSCAARSR